MKTSCESAAQAASSQTSNVCAGISLDLCKVSHRKALSMAELTFISNLASLSPPERQQIDPVCQGYTGFQELQTLSEKAHLLTARLLVTMVMLHRWPRGVLLSC